MSFLMFDQYLHVHDTQSVKRVETVTCIPGHMSIQQKQMGWHFCVHLPPPPGLIQEGVGRILETVLYIFNTTKTIEINFPPGGGGGAQNN